MNASHAGVLALVVVLSGGCASGVTRHEGSASHRLAMNQKVGAVSVSLTPAVKGNLEDNIKFNPNNLASMINRRLDLNGLTAEKATHSLNVIVTDVRVRSTFAAVMFGFMAGDDRIVGNAELKDASGKIVDKFEVSATYALGGWGGGQDDMRMSWLYEEFSKVLVGELKGDPATSSK